MATESGLTYLAAANIAAASVVLRHLDGGRLVRAGWFYPWVRAHESTISRQALAPRMARVGWKRPGSSGRIKATAPDRAATLGWNFWIVPEAWEGRS